MSLKIFKLSDEEINNNKLAKLREHFEKKYKSCPSLYVRAPGRVNIIGEHVDYCGYAVFPMAIEQDVTIAAVCTENNKLCISNVCEKYEDFECDINDFAINNVKHSWYKYILCGLQGIRDELETSTPWKGVSLLVVGNIPPSSGLSSSSALVCASALLFAHIFELKISQHALAELCAQAERYIGTQGGGMDQAASLLSNPGSAQLIEFNPLKCTPVSLPEGAKFVVASSLVENNKAAGSAYNTRVVECRLACRLLAKKSNLTINRNIQLGDLQRALGNNFSEMVELVKKYIHPQPYSKQELCQLLNMSVSRLEQEVLSTNTLDLTEFELQKRALHVFTEASRVWEFKNICDDWRGRAKVAHEEDRNKVLHQLGKLLDESHSSMQYLYECSHPKLDKMVEISKGTALGARLTGAGWGGCLIALVTKNKVEEYKNLMKFKYYNAENIKVEEWSNVLFSTDPCGGACILIPGEDN